MDFFLATDCFGTFIPISDHQVVRGAADHGWNQVQIDWLDQQIDHYTRALGVSFMRRFVTVDPPNAMADIGIANGIIYIPLQSSFAPEVLRTYVDWMLLHEPMHDKQRRLFGISESSILAYLESGGDVTALIRGVRDWETKYSIPPLKFLCSILPPSIVQLGIRLALDLHADARIFREGHKFIPPLSDDEVLHGLTTRSKLLVQSLVQCVCEMTRVQNARENGITPQITYLPYMARFAACIAAASMFYEELEHAQAEAANSHLIREGARLLRKPATAQAGYWITSVARQKASQALELNQILACDYESTVKIFLDSTELEDLYQKLAKSYTDLLLLMVSRREHFPHLPVLSEALNDEGDPLMRNRAIDYLTEVGSFEALGVLASRLQKESDQTVQIELMASLTGFGSKYPKEVLKALKTFRDDNFLGQDDAVLAKIAETVGEVLLEATYSSNVSGQNLRILTKRAEAILVPLLTVNTSSSESREHVVRAVLHALPLISYHPMVTGYLQIAADLVPKLKTDVIHALADCITYAHKSATRGEGIRKHSSRWHFEDYDVGAAHEDLMTTFALVMDEFDTLCQSKQKKIRAAVLEAYECMADTLAECGLLIKEQCLENLAAMALREKDSALCRKAISLISALFHPWSIDDPSEGQVVVVETLDEKIETPYKFHKANIHEFECIFAAYDQIIASRRGDTEAVVAEEIGRCIGGRFGPLHVTGSDGGMYAAIFWDYLENLKDSPAAAVRTGCAQTAVRFLVIVPVECLDLIEVTKKYLNDRNSKVRNRTAATIEEVLFQDREYLPLPPNDRVRRTYNAVVLVALEDPNLPEDVRLILARVKERWEREIGAKGEELDLPFPDLSDSEQSREQQLEELSNYLNQQFRAGPEEKRQMIIAVVRYILLESSPHLREKAVELIFAPFVIHEVPIDDAFPPFQYHEDGSVTEPIVLHPDSVAEVEAVLEGCRILLNQGDDCVKWATLANLGETFGHSDFLTSAGGKGCSCMAFDFMKSYSGHPNTSVRMGLAEGAVKIYNVLVGTSDGPSDLILDLLRDTDESVHKHTAAVVLKAITEYGQKSSFTRNLVQDVCAPVQESTAFPQAVRHTFDRIDTKAALWESLQRFQRFVAGADSKIEDEIEGIQMHRDREETNKRHKEILHALEAPEEEVRFEALRSVKTEKIVSATAALIRLCKKAVSPAERCEGVKVLGYVASDQGISYLMDCLSDQDRMVANQAARGLGRLRAAPAVPALIEVGLHSRFALVVATSVEALGRIYSKKNAALYPVDFEKTLEELARRGSARVEDKCAKTMERIKKNHRGSRPRRVHLVPPPGDIKAQNGDNLCIEDSDIPF
ncbi:MAG TPA: HEAT repeat domain-containing protein [Sedimentisphaerales bacterium]|nr:HEAT repeat domain-containing protein [Sedimentisphaerales bacterium]